MGVSHELKGGCESNSRRKEKDDSVESRRASFIEPGIVGRTKGDGFAVTGLFSALVYTHLRPDTHVC